MTLRALVAGAVGIAAALFGFMAGLGVTGSRPAATLAGALAGGLAAWLARRSRSLPVDETAAPRGLLIVSGLTTLVALGLLVRLAVFIADPSRTGCSIVPGSRWEIEHSCLSAYHVAAQAAASHAHLFDDALYSMPGQDPTAPRKALMLGPFKIDVYEYPPQFLLLPWALRLLTPEFIDLRMLWFALNGAVLLTGLVVVAAFLGPRAGTRALLLSPLVWISLPTTLGTLQKGNVQILVIGASMLAMALFARRRDAAGGGLLGFVTASKLYPGLFVIYLMMRRQWRSAAWTVACGGAFSVATLLLFGWQPFADFLRHLPGLLGGEAFPAFRNPAAMAINLSVPGLAFKLKLLGVPGMSFGAAKILGWAYTLVALAALVFAARRAERDGDNPLLWLAILIVATLRSPFLPAAYGTIPAIWLLTLLAATRDPLSRSPGLVILGWVALNLYWPIDWPIDFRLLAVVTTLTQAVMVLLVLLVLRERRDAAPAGAAQAITRTGS